MKLHLGCGNDKSEGYINCDISKEVNPDKIVDLEKTPLPFKDSSVEEIILNHVLEHINDFIPLVHDLHRICKKDAKIRIKVPFYLAYRQFGDPTHVRFFNPFTFDYFGIKKGYSHETNTNKQMFDVKAHLNYGVGKIRYLNFIFNPIINVSHKFYCQFLATIIPASEIHFELRVIK